MLRVAALMQLDKGVVAGTEQPRQQQRHFDVVVVAVAAVVDFVVVSYWGW